MKSLWKSAFQPASVIEALTLLREHGTSARIVAGGTDVVVELSRGVNTTGIIIDISRLPELQGITVSEGRIRLGSLTTHNEVLASTDCVQDAFPLAQACAEIGAPQLRTRATIAGNIVTASPANDTISALIALDATVTLQNLDRTRAVPIESFFRGFRETVLQQDELIRSIEIPRSQPNQRGLFRKLGLRRAQAISVIHFAIVLGFDGERVASARISLGCVAPTVIRAPKTEAWLSGQLLTEDVISEAGRIVASEASPIDDVRGSGEYRTRVLERTFADSLSQLRDGSERRNWMPDPVLLDTGRRATDTEPFMERIITIVNGERCELSRESNERTLLNAIRDELSLTGSKEGCAEGECGACTMWLDGQAVMSCLVPAIQAHGRELVTIEGLAETSGQPVHPLQAAFVNRAAVQCGFCIPGMVMAGAKLLEECPTPSDNEVKVALSGNICRCTGYAKILEAVHEAAADGK
jgi:carbon-monoxide dehydrogenase medium subunit